jgi:hypothetical protein
MILERTNTEILVRLPLNVDLTELQNMIDYLRYKELTANSKAEQADADLLANAANSSMMQKFRSKRANK